MYQLFYVSSAKGKVDQKVVDSILSVARKVNPGLGITGILLYHGGIFLQLLEGDRDKVTSLYEKIKSDQRHDNVVSLLEAEGNPRIFSEWSMAYRELSDLDIKAVNEILSWNKLIARAEKIDNVLISQMLERFKRFIEK